MEGFVAALKGSFTSPLRAVKERQRAKDFITPLIIIGAMFILLWGVNSCIFGNMAVSAHHSKMDGVYSSYYKFNFGFVILASLIETITLACCYVGARFVLALAFVRPFNPGKFILDSFISFGVNSIIPICAMVAGGLFYMALGIIGQIFFGFAMFWYVLMLAMELFDEIPAERRNFGFIISVVGMAIVMVLAFIMVYKLMFMMNMGGKTVEDGRYVRDIYYSRVFGTHLNEHTGDADSAVKQASEIVNRFTSR